MVTPATGAGPGGAWPRSENPSGLTMDGTGESLSWWPATRSGPGSSRSSSGPCTW